MSDEPSPEELAREFSGKALRDVTDPKDTSKVLVKAGQQLNGFAELRDDGSTSCGCWLFAGSWSEQGNLMARAGEQPNAEIRLNGVKWQIPRGKAVDVPLPVYEQFQRKLRNEASEIKLQNAMMASMSPENFGLGYRLGEEPEGI